MSIWCINKCSGLGTLHKNRKRDLTNFLRKVCEKILSKPKVRQIGKVTNTSGKGGQLIISQNQFLRKKHIFKK